MNLRDREHADQAITHTAVYVLSEGWDMEVRRGGKLIAAHTSLSLEEADEILEFHEKGQS